MDDYLTWYRVNLSSAPAPGSSHYSGYVDVVAVDEDDAISRAIAKLKRGAFSERDSGSWIIGDIELLSEESQW